MAAGLKCGGTLHERAERLWMTRGKERCDWDPKAFVKPPRAPWRNRRRRNEYQRPAAPTRGRQDSYDHADDYTASHAFFYIWYWRVVFLVLKCFFASSVDIEGGGVAAMGFAAALWHH